MDRYGSLLSSASTIIQVLRGYQLLILMRIMRTIGIRIRSKEQPFLGCNLCETVNGKLYKMIFTQASLTLLLLNFNIMFWLLLLPCFLLFNRRVITNDRRLTELCLLHISNTFLNILAVPNKATFCITPTWSGIPSFSIHLSNPLVTLPRAPITTGMSSTLLSFHNLPISLSLQILVFFHFFPFFLLLLLLLVLCKCNALAPADVMPTLH